MNLTIPERSTQFVAYDTHSVDTPDEHGQPVRFRPQTMVREFPSVLVKNAETKQVKHGDRTLTTTNYVFDAKSTGIPNFSRDFGANLTGDDPANQLLQHALKNHLPVYVALETVRRRKNSDGQEIHPTATIAELRGAKPDNSGGDSSTTKNNCVNIVAAVAPAGHPEKILVTSEARSDPAEWPQLHSNKSGTYAPTGWVPRDGGIANAPAGGTAAAAGDVDVEALAAAVAAKLADQITVPVDPQKGTRPVKRNTVSGEGRAWEPWNSDGSLNGGSDLLAKDRATYRYALRLLMDCGVVADLLPTCRKLTSLLLWMADKVVAVQEQERRFPRLYRSHRESGMWVEMVIDSLSQAPGMESYRFTPHLMTDDVARHQWAKAVVELASQLYRDSLDEATAYLTNKPVAQPTAQPATPAPQAVSSPQSAPQPTQTAPVASTAVDPWNAEDPVSAAAELSPAMADTLRDQWLQLLDSTCQNGAQYEHLFRPLLQQEFGSVDLATIPADWFATQLQAWGADRAAFMAAGKAAKEAAAPAKVA